MGLALVLVRPCMYLTKKVDFDSTKVRVYVPEQLHMKRCPKWCFVWMRCSGGVIIRCRHLVTVNKCVVWRTANAGIKYQVTLTWRQTNDNDWPSLREPIWSYVFTATSHVGFRTPQSLWHWLSAAVVLHQGSFLTSRMLPSEGSRVLHRLNARLCAQIWRIVLEKKKDHLSDRSTHLTCSARNNAETIECNQWKVRLQPDCSGQHLFTALGASQDASPGNDGRWSLTCHEQSIVSSSVNCCLIPGEAQSLEDFNFICVVRNGQPGSCTAMWLLHNWWKKSRGTHHCDKLHWHDSSPPPPTSTSSVLHGGGLKRNEAVRTGS